MNFLWKKRWYLFQNSIDKNNIFQIWKLDAYLPTKSLAYTQNLKQILYQVNET